MIVVRSVLFNLAFYGWTLAMVVLCAPALVLRRAASVRAMAIWAKGVNWLLRRLVGIAIEIRGRESLPSGACIVASAHQSAWDTLIYHVVFGDPAMVMKRELMLIPIYGWYARKTGMIPVDRKGGGAALRVMLRAARAAAQAGRSIVIFPQGTRVAPGVAAPLLPGIAALYRDLDLPVVPVALNSGLFWPRRRFLRQPGRILLEFQSPIAPGLGRDEFIAELAHRIDTANARLLSEGRGMAGEVRR